MTESNNPLEYEIRKAFLDVSAPAAMKQRLLARIHKEAAANRPLLSDAVSEALGTEPVDAQAATDSSATQSVSPAIAAEGTTESNASRSSRRYWLGSAVAAACIVVGFFVWPAPPLSRQDVAQRGIQLASALDDGLVAEDSWELNPTWPFGGLLNVRGVLGYAQVSNEHFGGSGKHCDVWKVTDNRSDFYVIKVPEADVAAEIIGVLRSLPSSGGWCIAAMKTADSLVLVIGHSDVDHLIRKGQYT